MQLRRQTVEHPFGTITAWIDATHFLTRGLKRVSTGMSLQVLACNEVGDRDPERQAADGGDQDLKASVTVHVTQADRATAMLCGDPAARHLTTLG